MLKMIAVSLAFAVAAAAPLSAQGRGQKANDIPPGMRPPAGMCRIWLDGVPPGQQPAPTDCATAVRNRPSNGRVIFGDDYVDGKGRKSNGGDKRQTAPREDRRRDDGEHPSTSSDRRSRRHDVETTKDRKRGSVPDSGRAVRKPE
jgi:hypothetical protein